MPVYKKVVVVGCNPVSKQLVESFSSSGRIRVAGFFEDIDHNNHLSSIPKLGAIRESVAYAMDNKISEIYCTISPEKHQDIYQLAEESESNFIRFRFVDTGIFVDRAMHIDFSSDLPILSSRPQFIHTRTAVIFKRGFDIIFSSFVIFFILSWLVPLVSVLIKLDSKGPVFFSQLRSGKNNKPFLCFKFRSLKINDEAHTKQVTLNDDRLTKLGRFLRKSNIDELPQFINVLFGQMSVVGPRPHMLKHTEEFCSSVRRYMVRHSIKPGVTGWAQVNGYRGEIKKCDDLRKRVEHDIWYMENWTIWLDLKIIFMTVYRALTGDQNAY